MHCIILYLYRYMIWCDMPRYLFINIMSPFVVYALPFKFHANELI
jgi:hypothetical protein